MIRNETKNYRAEGVMENTITPNRKTTKATGRMRPSLREPTSSRMSITNSFNNVRENKRLDIPGDKSHVENRILSPLPSPRNSKILKSPTNGVTKLMPTKSPSQNLHNSPLGPPTA